MKPENTFKTFVATCTRSLADDEAMRREVSFELNNHLEEAYEEELSRAESPEEAAEMAKKRFGQPEELAVQLLNANIKRFSFRVRMRWLLKIVFIPLFLAGIILCLDLRFWGGLVVFDHAEGGSWGIPPVIDELLIDLIYPEELRSTSPAKELLAAQFAGIDHVGELKNAAELYKFDPASKIYTAYYAQLLAMDIQEFRKTDKTYSNQFYHIIAHGREIDPDNALYDYLEAYVISECSIENMNDSDEKQDTGSTEFIISDRAGLDRAMDIYLAGTRKPFMKTYNTKLAEEAYSFLRGNMDLLHVYQRIAVYSDIMLPYLSMLKSLTMNMIFYGEILMEEGSASGEKLLKSWKDFLPQIIGNSECIIDVLVYGNFADMYLEAIQRHGGNSSTLAQVADIIHCWQEAGDANAEIKEKYKPIFSRNFLIKGEYKLPEDCFVAENRMFYSVLDMYSLLPLCLMLTVLIIIFAVIAGVNRLRGRKPFIMLLPWRSYCRIVVVGIVIPLGLFFLYIHIDWLSGRNMPAVDNLLHIGLEKLVFVVCFPIYFGIIVRQQLKKSGKNMGFPHGKIPVGTYCLNMMFFWTLLLCMTGVVAGRLFNYKISLPSHTYLKLSFLSSCLSLR